jgi:hypothetical protein
MSHPAPWQLLIHDTGREDRDPKFILCTVASPADVRPAGGEDAHRMGNGPDVDDVTARWVAARHGTDHVDLTPLPHATVWRVDEGGNAPRHPLGGR